MRVSQLPGRALVVLVALTAFAAMLGATLSSAATDTYVPADDPWLKRAIEDEQTAAAKRRTERSRPDARAQRKTSRTAYAGLGESEALDLAKGVFARFVEHPLWRPSRPADDETIDRYLDDHNVLMNVEGRARKRLLVSTLPLRTRGAEGQKRPVSIEFEDFGAFIRPANALTAIRLNKRLGDGAALPSSGVSVRPVGVNDVDAQAQVTAQRLFWANVDTDTDFMIGLLPDGFQTFHQPRGRSPDRAERVAHRNWTTKLDRGGRVVYQYNDSRLGWVRTNSKGTVLTMMGRTAARISQIPRWKR